MFLNSPSRVVASDMARKWPRMSGFGRRICSPRADACSDFDTCSTSVADKHHFVVYTSEGERLMVPLEYLDSSVFQELLKRSEKAYGFQSDGPFALPCDAVFMEYGLPLLRRRVSEYVERGLLSFIFVSCQSSCSSVCRQCSTACSL